MRSPFPRFASAGATLALALTVSCGPRTLQRVTIGVSPWPGYELVHLALEQGYFAEEGLQVRLVEHLSPGDTRRTYERGQFDVWCASNAEVLFARAQSARQPRLVLVFDASNGADVLLAEERVRTLADLRGQRVALEPASLDVIAVHHALASAGMTLDDIEVVGMPQGDVPSALAAGRVVAAETYPPMSREVMRSGARFHKLFDSSRAPGAILDVLVMDATFIQREPRAARGILSALRRAERFLHEHRSEADQAIAAREHLTAEELARAFGGIELMPFTAQDSLLAPGGVAEGSLAAARAALLAGHALDATVDISGLVDRTPLRMSEEFAQ